MSKVCIKRVRSAADRRRLITFPWTVYADDPAWVPPLIPERKKVVDPEQGVFFKRGEAAFFLAYRDGELAGTICAAEDPPINRRRGTRECLFGFFEYVRDFRVFQALIRTAADWARARGLDTLYGPWNLDYEDGYGVLIEGYQRPPALMCGHNPPYYREFMERAGFSPARPENVALEIKLEVTPRIKRLHRLAEKISRRTRITIREADFSRWDQEVDAVHGLLNRCLSHLEDSIGWRRDNLEAMLSPFRKIADQEMILFAEVEGDVVGFLPGVPNMNEILGRVNGLRRPWNYLQLAWLARSHQFRGLSVKSVLVLPEYWNRGVAVLLFEELFNRARNRGYQWADLSLTSLDNPSSVLTARKLGADIYKRWQVYHLSLD